MFLTFRIFKPFKPFKPIKPIEHVGHDIVSELRNGAVETPVMNQVLIMSVMTSKGKKFTSASRGRGLIVFCRAAVCHFCKTWCGVGVLVCLR
jgi:hypothetical protein